MKIQVSWDDEAHTIIRYDYSEGWTWEEFHSAGKQVTDMMNTAGRTDFTYHLIANFADRAFPPMNALVHFKNGQASLPQNTVVVVVGGGMFITALVTAFGQIYRELGKNVVAVRSLEEARAKIAQLRARNPENHR